MPICPKCGELISGKKFERHVKRCGTHHRRKEPSEPYVPSYVSSIERVGPRGVLVPAETVSKEKPHRRSKSRDWLAIVLVVAVAAFLAAAILGLL